MLTCKCISNNGLKYILAVFVLVPLIVYVYHFYSSNLSDKTVDWGAFGSYISGTIGVISVILLYITYKEQCRSNSISQFEQRYYTQLKIIREMLMAYDKDVEKMYRHIEKHFSGNSFQSLNRSDVLMACGYYYGDLRRQEHFRGEIDQVISYVLHSIKMTSEYETLSGKQKKDYIQDLFPIKNEYFLVLLLFCVISKKDVSSFHLLLDYKCYDGVLFRNKLLSKTIDSIKSARSLTPTLIVAGNEIEYKNYEGEPIYKTIERLKKKIDESV